MALATVTAGACECSAAVGGSLASTAAFACACCRHSPSRLSDPIGDGASRKLLADPSSARRDGGEGMPDPVGVSSGKLQTEGGSSSSSIVNSIGKSFPRSFSADSLGEAAWAVGSAVVGPPLTFVVHHIQLTASGEVPHVDVRFSALVAASSLLYLGVAAAFFANGLMVMGVLMACIAVSSLFSDSVCPQSKFWCSLDRVLCTMGVYGPVRALALAESWSLRVQIMAVLVGTLWFLSWSRRSRTQLEFELRHTLWHVVSSISLSWLAFVVPAGP